MKARIIEIFSSVQGEGHWVGKPQVFVRFHGCRLQCTFCDTPLTHKNIHEARIEFPPYSKQFQSHSLEFTPQELDECLRRFGIPSLALTGGEPLEQADFIHAWLSGRKDKSDILLETSGVEVDGLEKVISLVDMVSLDIKLPSSSGEKPYWDLHDRFIAVALQKACYGKVVYNEKITEEEKGHLRTYLEKYPSFSLVFQPVMPLRLVDLPQCLEIFHEFSLQFPDRVRLIPQVHKFLTVL